MQADAKFTFSRTGHVQSSNFRFWQCTCSLPNNFCRPPRPLHRACKHYFRLELGKPLARCPRLLFPLRGKRKIEAPLIGIPCIALTLAMAENKHAHAMVKHGKEFAICLQSLQGGGFFIAQRKFRFKSGIHSPCTIENFGRRDNMARTSFWLLRWRR